MKPTAAIPNQTVIKPSDPLPSLARLRADEAKKAASLQSKSARKLRLRDACYYWALARS